MELITYDDLNRWADTVESEALLPRLIALLIYETAPLSTKIDMPWGSCLLYTSDAADEAGMV